MRHYRWGDHDRHLGPVTYDTRSGYEAYGVRLRSGKHRDRGKRWDAYDDAYCGWDGPVLCLHWGKLAAFLPLPHWTLRPWRRWVEAGPAHRRDDFTGYWDVHTRELGLVLTRSGTVGERLDTVSLTYGRQTYESWTDRSKTWFLPFMEHRLVRTTLLTPTLEVHHERREPRPLLLRTRRRREARREARQDSWAADREHEESCPHVFYVLRDEYDGAAVTARVWLVEREWRRGDGWFWWMGGLRSLFAPVVLQTLDVTYSDEVGPRKGSWKGGTLASSSPASVADDLDASARAYFERERLTVLSTTRFVGVDVPTFTRAEHVSAETAAGWVGEESGK